MSINESNYLTLLRLFHDNALRITELRLDLNLHRTLMFRRDLYNISLNMLIETITFDWATIIIEPEIQKIMSRYSLSTKLFIIPQSTLLFILGHIGSRRSKNASIDIRSGLYKYKWKYELEIYHPSHLCLYPGILSYSYTLLKDPKTHDLYVSLFELAKELDQVWV